MKRPRSRRVWQVVAVVVLLFTLGRWLDRSQPIVSYRAVDDRRIAVTVDSSSPQWTRVTGVTETEDRVIVSLGSFIFPSIQPPAGLGRSEELLVTLAQPLGGRWVVDGNTGRRVERMDCSWPLLSQGKCAGQTSPP